MCDQAIGIFDSGVGGISVLARAQQLLPHENYIYYADSAGFPYGDKTPDEVRQRVIAAVDSMVERGIKALVVACNTATSIAIQDLRDRYAFPILGMEPAVKQAVECCPGQRIAVVATTLTLQERKFRTLHTAVSSAGELIPVPASGLADIVEHGDYASEQSRAFIQNLFRDVGHLDGIVLGCTHYLYLIPLIREIYPNATIFGGGDGTIRHLKRLLDQEGLLRVDGEGKLEVLSSDPAQFLPRFQRFHRDIEIIFTNLDHIMV